MIFKTINQERAARKWKSWSAHFAWGVVFSLAGSMVMHHASAWLLSMILGIMWEIGYWLMTDKATVENRASVVDAIAWIMGSGTGAIWFIIFAKGG